VGEPVEEVGSELCGESCPVFRRADVEDGKLTEGQDGRADHGVGFFRDAAEGGVLGEAAGPGLVEPLLECAALVGPVFVVVGAVTMGQMPARWGGLPMAASIWVAPT